MFSKAISVDFNYPCINWETWSSTNDSTTAPELRFIECIRYYFLTQHVTKPTRWRGTDKPKTLDLRTNDENIISNIEYLSTLGNGDHCVVNFYITGNYKMGNITKTRKYFNRCNYTELNEDITQTDWVQLFAEENDNDANWCKFHDIITRRQTYTNKDY